MHMLNLTDYKGATPSEVSCDGLPCSEVTTECEMKLGNVEIQKQRCLNRVRSHNGSSRPSAASDLASGWFFDMRC
jgi:hypothetical protein